MKFSQLIKGDLARKPIKFPLQSGEEVDIHLASLGIDDDAEVLAAARRHAIDRGVPEPRDGDPLYDQGLWLHTVARACIDPDSPEDAPTPFFDGGVAQIMAKGSGIDRDRLALLYELQQAWQDEIAPRPGAMTAEEYFDALARHVELPEGSVLPFERWRPSMRRLFVHTMAVQLVAFYQLRSLPGASSPETEKSSEKSPAP